jgi:hypothetical protein
LRDAFRERVEWAQLSVLDRGQEVGEAPLSFPAASGSVAGAEHLLQSPRLGEEWVALEQRTQPTAVALGQAL